ncbi:FMN reductase [Nesterenkonia alkaliphila]|nr:FMN reductase [Nesterenkonia alkaliphila]
MADWALAALEARGGVEPDLIDLTSITLPDDRLLYPGGSPRTDTTDRLADAEAFVFVTPEYNHSFPASLKRFIDWHLSEWSFKPAAIIAYGARGGYACVEHLKGVLNELDMVTVARSIGLQAPWEHLNAQGVYSPGEGARGALENCLAELHWWTELLSWARANRPFRT